MRIHVLGVAGTGMGAVAGFLAQSGHSVSGSDIAFHPPMGPKLAEWGVQTCAGYAAEHVPQDAELVVIGNVCRADNVEAKRAFELGIETTHIAGALQRFALKNTRPLVVAGTHGKTTTSSLCAWLLECCDTRPGFFIGGIPLNFGQGFRPAAPGAPFVVEGDEYDTAFFEKTPKFLHYAAENAILTSIEHDHVDIYPTEASYHAAFARFIELLPVNGVLVANAQDHAVRELITAHARCRVEWYQVSAPAATSEPSSTWRIARHRVNGDVQEFDVCRAGETLGSVSLPLSGAHNVANALAAIAVCATAYGCKVEALCKALSRFEGSARRQQLLGTPRGIRVYDDFAHHPSAVRTTLQGLKARHPEARLAAVFEARSATACRRQHQSAYAEAFDAADLTLFAPIGRPEIPAEQRLDLDLLCRELAARGQRALACSDAADIITQIAAWARAGDSVVLMSNGTLAGITPRLLETLKNS